MEERSEVDKMDEIMLPGFRFHPTDEELVGFYLKRKIQQRPLSIELIKQLDIYKYDPWDLPKLATIGEKEWYFYCPRDRKYRNSTRPNRVTEAGFWKATGTDRAIYSSEGSNCIGLKKSLVFYKGRAAKGTKTDWMMHEYRLPSLSDSVPQKRFMDKNIHANDSWAICRIFKKTNTSAQRAASHSWVSPGLETATYKEILRTQSPINTSFTSQSISLQSKSCSSMQYSSNNHQKNSYNTSNFSLNKPQTSISNDNHNFPFNGFSCNFEPLYTTSQNISSSIFEEFGVSVLQEKCDGLLTLPQMQEISGNDEQINRGLDNLSNGGNFGICDDWGRLRSNIGTPSSLLSAWKSTSSPCLSELSANYSTNKCYF